MTFWDEWRGTENGDVVMRIKRLLHFKGYRLDLHQFNRSDPKECFHTHPAKAVRIVLWGGYIEEVYPDKLKVWFPLRFGTISPYYCHRIAGLLCKTSYSLWFRWPVTENVELIGKGWTFERMQDKSKGKYL